MLPTRGSHRLIRDCLLCRAGRLVTCLSCILYCASIFPSGNGKIMDPPLGGCAASEDCYPESTLTSNCSISHTAVQGYRKEGFSSCMCLTDYFPPSLRPSLLPFLPSSLVLPFPLPSSSHLIPPPTSAVYTHVKMKPGTQCMLDKRSTMELHPQPLPISFKSRFCQWLYLSSCCLLVLQTLSQAPEQP